MTNCLCYVSLRRCLRTTLWETEWYTANVCLYFPHYNAKHWQWKCVTHLKTEDLDNKVRWMNAEYRETCLEHNTKGSGHFSASDLLLFSKVPFLLGERPCTVRSTLCTGSATKALINTALLLSGILFNLLLCFFFLFHLRGMFKCYAHIRNLLKARLKPFLFTL